MPDLKVKDNGSQSVIVRYQGGKVRLMIQNHGQVQPQMVGDYANLDLTPNDWERLVKWIEYLRAEDRVSAP